MARLYCHICWTLCAAGTGWPSLFGISPGGIKHGVLAVACVQFLLAGLILGAIEKLARKP